MKIGDVVRAKAGGPKMTVERIREGDVVADLVWFDTDHNLHRDSFLVENLDVADPRPDREA